MQSHNPSTLCVLTVNMKMECLQFHFSIFLKRICSVLLHLRPYVIMVCLQCGMAVAYILIKLTLNHRMNRYVLIVYRNAFAAIALAPFAILLERKIRPKMTLPIFFHIMAMGFLEPILDQGCAYLGMQYTSASFASAIMNAVPSVTFLIAAILRLERVNVTGTSGIAKVAGTLASFGGALLMALFKGPVVNFPWTRHVTDHDGRDTGTHHWVVGTVLLLIGCVAWSVFYVVQSMTVKKYPAELSLSTLICLSGTVQSSLVALAVAPRHAWAVGWGSRLLAPIYMGLVGSGIAYYVQALVMKTRGPVFATAFNPLCMIIVAGLGSFILHEQIHVGSVIGSVIIAFGLYCVVWGKSKDDQFNEIEDVKCELPVKYLQNSEVMENKVDEIIE